MSLLTPLYILGLSAIVAPIVFHLIRRSPRGEVPFSSLMFLSPTPPSVTRRSRLDHWLLLLLRAAALALLAFAFARPFLRQPALLGNSEVPRQRIALLIDTSASMRRGDLWLRAKATASKVIAGCQPTDQLALFSFDVAARPLLSFEESAKLDSNQRQAVAQGLLKGLAPTWGGTNLGQALIDTVTAIEDVTDKSEKSGRMPRRVVLVSDLQQGSRLDSLGDFEWPSDVTLDLKTVTGDGSNAGLHALGPMAEAEPAQAGKERRVRVSNDAGSRLDKFELIWVDEKGAGSGSPIEVYVPPAESRVVRVPRPAEPLPARSLRLLGDGYEFDNTLYFTEERREEATVLYVGEDKADDSTGHLYYLQRAFFDTTGRKVNVVSSLPSAVLAWEPKHPPSLIVVTTEPSAENVRRLHEYERGGGTLLYVVTAPGRAESLAKLADVATLDVEEAIVSPDVILGEIIFNHPLFAPFAAAQFNDFTKIHFWKYRRIDPKSLGEARVLARFENGDAAVVEKAVGKGRLIVMTSGWQPVDSQLARSSKFVPLMAALLEGRDARPLDAKSYMVHDRVPLPAMENSAAALTVHKPDGVVVKTTPNSEFFAETDQPGVFTVDTPGGARSFAVNLDPMESKTVPLNVERLEELGCRLASHIPKKVDQEQLRQMFSAELENRQKLWRWLILAAIGVLIVETWLAGRLVRPRSTLSF
jgi:Aerotolerance regulator N-terminal/von Willebrand factor type A domain